MQSSSSSPPPPPMFLPKDALSFLSLMADTLRLTPETLSTAHVYIHRYHRWTSEDPDSPSISLLDDDHTLHLTALSLSTKATESPRRLRELLLPAYHLLHPASPPLTFPSPLYDSLRSTLVAAELLLLRVLRFELRIPLPYDFLARFLERVLPDVGGVAAVAAVGEEEREESRIVDVCDTGLGREVWGLVGRAMTSYKVCNFFPARSVAAACLYHVAARRGLKVGGGEGEEEREEWLKRLTGGRVDYVDFVEAVEELEGLCNQNTLLRVG